MDETQDTTTSKDKMPMKTLLLCFIHGFKGDEETFYHFGNDLKAGITTSTPNLNVETIIYPKYETRGDLALSVETFKEWLQSQVLTLEKSNSNPSPIINPSVSVILVAHSMGGFVAADTLFSVLDHRPSSDSTSTSNDNSDEKEKKMIKKEERNLMFPLIQGVLAFDTPFDGLSRSMFAYGAFSQYQNISSAWNLLSTGTAFLASAGARTAATSQAQTVARNQLASRGANSSNSLMRWSALAARTGTYGAIMAGGVAAYIHRDQILQSLKGINRENISKINYANTRDAVTSINYTESLSQGLTYVSRESIGEGFAWMAGHLKFVGALMKTTQLTTRLERLSGIEGVGVKCLYTSLGENGVWSGGYFVPKRAFCAIPSGQGKGKDGDEKKVKAERMKELFVECPDVKAGNEIVAHCGMFRKEKNENYENMLKLSVDLVGEWLMIDPREVKDEWKPSREQLQRTMSEAQVWDDDGKVLKPPGGDGDEGQLDAILKSDEMPQGEDGGFDEKELMERAANIPLPVDEDIVGEGVLQTKIQQAEDAVKAAQKQESPSQQSTLDDNISRQLQKDKASGDSSEVTPDEQDNVEIQTATSNTEDSKLRDANLNQDMAKTSLADKEGSVEAVEPKSNETSTAPNKSWLGYIPNVPSLASKANAPSASENEDKDTTVNTEDKSATKTWASMMPNVPSFTAKTQDTQPTTSGGSSEQAGIHSEQENTATKDIPAPKTWVGMIPSVPSFTAKKQDGEQKKETANISEQKDDSKEFPAAESRKKWFGVV